CVFFFQAEDGIRDRNVTGVQTCALPILSSSEAANASGLVSERSRILSSASEAFEISSRRKISLFRYNELMMSFIIRLTSAWNVRSEERRVGEEWRGWERLWHERIKQTLR